MISCALWRVSHASSTSDVVADESSRNDPWTSHAVQEILRRQMRRHVATCCVVMWCTVCDAEAQGPVGYVSFGISRHTEQGPEGQIPFAFYPALPGGTTSSFIAAGGMFLARRIGVDGEVMRTGSMWARQPSRYFTLTEERRELLITTGVRFRRLWPGAIQFEPTVAALFVRSSGWTQLEYDPPVVSSHRADPRNRTQDVRFGVAGGLDAVIGGEHVAAVPAFRILYVFSEYSRSARAWQWALRPSLSLRVTF